MNKDNKHLPRKEYDEIISKMDALYFPYDSNSYRVSASGAVYEAISKQKPIISTENDYFKSLFSQFGQMGYLFNDFSELRAIFLQLNNRAYVGVLQENALRASEYLSPENYYEVLKKILRID